MLNKSISLNSPVPASVRSRQGLTLELFALGIGSKEGVQSKLIAAHDGSEIIFQRAVLPATGAEEVKK